jgi:uncharacterized repeat protein (TIGR01451 family)
MIKQILSINLIKKTTATFAVLCLLVVSLLTSFAIAPVANALGAPITGTLFVDFSRDGIIDLGEKVPSTDKYYPTSGITVTAYDDLGNSVQGVVTSGANGVTYSVDPSTLSGTKFRLVFGLNAADKAAGWTETFNGKDSQSSVVVVQAGTVQNFGVIPPSKAPVTGTGADGNANNYNGKLFATEFINGARDDTSGPQNVLLGLNYDRTGGLENLANKPKLGSIWGLAYDEWSSNLFTSAYLKRHVELGPEGLDGLYWITYPNETLKQVSLETLGGPSFGTIGARDSDNIAYYQSSRDATSFSKIDKIGIGDIDVSKDGRTLFVTNIAAKAIMAYDVSNAANGTISYLGNYAITNTDAACPNNSGNNNPSDWYPFALEPIDGDSLYVGITCIAQTSQSRLDLTAKVLELTLTPAGTNNNVIPVSSKLIHTVDLNYNKGCPILTYCTTTNQGGFHPWQDDYTKFPQNRDPAGDGDRIMYPQPVFTDINISRDGSMTLNIMDRTTDQFGYRNYDPGGNFIRAYAGGDIIKVCNTSANPLTPTYLTEGVAGCKGTNTGQGPNNSSTEFYFDDFPGYHSDTTLGGAWTHPYLNEMVSGQFDPLTTGSLITGGLSWLNTASGSEITAKELYSGGNDVGFAGKANGIGDIEGAYVPVAIGDYVWLDSDGDGIQDPNEQPLAGVKVTATCAGLFGGSIVKYTDANGKYEFTSADGLLPGQTCTIKFDPTTATNLPAGITPASLTPTKTVSGTDPLSDSNINSTGTLTTVPLVLGQVNHSYDAGFVPPIKAIDDTNTTPLNTPITYCPLANDMAPVGSKITVINGITVVVGTPIIVTNGKVVVNADGCITFTPNPGYTGVVTFPYTITSPNGQTSSAIDTITITGTGKIDLIKAGTFIDTNANGAAEVGETIKYSFTVKNTGSLALTNVKVTDNKCSPVLGGPISLAVGASDVTTFTCTYTLTAADITLGRVDNQATVTGTDPTGKPVTDLSDSTDPTKPGLDDPTVTPLPVKAIDDTKTTPINTPIKYCPLINDMVPAGSKITGINGQPATVGVPITVPNGTVTLEADGCVTFTPATGYVGTVTFPYEVTTPNGTKVTAIDTITITGTGSIELIKVGTFVDTNANGAAEVGETVKYTFTVKNTGPLALTNVKVTDNKCSPVLGGPISLAVGASDTATFTCTYTLTAADITLGRVDNQATVTGTDPTGKPVTDLSDSTDPTKPGTNDPTVTPLPALTPKAIDDVKTTTVNTPIKYCPLINDMVPTGSKITGINGLPATVGVPIAVPNGTVTLEADGCVTFTPATGFTGTVTFPYEVTTPNGTKVTAIDTITIPQVPVANPDVKETPINTPVKICPLANDMVPAGSTITGINGQPATVGVPIVVPNGTVTLLADGCITFTPNTGYTGTVTFPYEVTTPTGVKVTSTVTVTVVGAVDDSKVTPINTPIKYCPLVNDMVPTGSKITSINGIAAIVGTPIVVPNGTVTLEADGCVTFTPASGYTGTVTFPYEVTTPSGTVVKAIDTITITGTGSIELIKASTFVDTNNDKGAQPGELIKYTFTVKNTGPLALTNIKVTDNKCSPVLGGPISLAVGAIDTTTFTCTYSLTAADIAAEKVENSATVTGTDPSGKPVTDISDSTDPSKPGTNDPTVTQLPPIAVDDNKTTPKNTPIKYCPLINDMVPDGSKVTSINGQIATVGVPIAVTNGTVTLEADGCVTFTPTTGFTGVVTFPYEVTTPAGKVVKAIDTITIPDVPTANPDVKETPINTPVKICPLANDMPLPAGSKITGINGQIATVGTPITVPNGTVTLDADGCITFTPAPGFTGTSTFPYEVTTPTGVKVTSTVTVTVVGAVDDSKTTPVNTPIKYCPLINDMVPTGSKVTSINGVTAVVGLPIVVPNGTVTLEADGCVTFTPNKDYTGTVTYPYEVTTPNGTVVKAIDTIVIPPVIPVLVDDNKVTPVNTPITYSPMVNDPVPTGSTITQINGTPVVIGQPIVVPNGTVVVNADQTVTFTPTKDYVGIVTFPYEVTTPAGVKVKAIDTITIVSAVDDNKVTPINTPIKYCPLINDMVPAGSKITSINGQPLTVGVAVTVPNGKVVLEADGCVTFTPNTGYVGTVVFPYEVTTPTGEIVKAIDTITINGEGKIELDKAATYIDANNDGALSLGETVKYSFTIKNTGATTLTNVTVTDTMPGIMIAGTPIPSMAPGDVNTTAYTATYIVTQQDLDKGSVVNQATVSGTDPKGNIVKDISNDPSTTLGNDPTALYIPKPTSPCNPCGGCNSSCGTPCAGTTGCNSGCGTGNCMPITSISCITNTNTVTITGGSGPMVSPVYNYNNVFNSNVNFTQGPISFNFSPVVNNYYK